jgi:hypothetical protein
MHMHSPNKPQKFKHTSSCQKADGNCFLGREWRAGGGIHVTRDHRNTRRALQKRKKELRAIQNKRCGMPTSCVTLLHDN